MYRFMHYVEYRYATIIYNPVADLGGLGGQNPPNNYADRLTPPPPSTLSEVKFFSKINSSHVKLGGGGGLLCK